MQCTIGDPSSPGACLATLHAQLFVHAIIGSISYLEKYSPSMNSEISCKRDLSRVWLGLAPRSPYSYPNIPCEPMSLFLHQCPLRSDILFCRHHDFSKDDGHWRPDPRLQGRHPFVRNKSSEDWVRPVLHRLCSLCKCISTIAKIA